VVRENDVVAVELALGKAQMKRDHVEAIWQDYQARLHASTTSQ
jgi:hypothetical protein